MTYLKAIIVGVATALLAAVLLVVGMFVLPAWLSMAFSGSGGIGAVSVGSGATALVLVLIVGFALGFFWTLRRRKRRGKSLP